MDLFNRFNRKGEDMKRLIILLCSIGTMVLAQQSYTVIVSDIENLNVTREDAQRITNVIIDKLTQDPRITVVDRNSLGAILAEMKLQLSGMTETQAVEVGKLAGAQYFIQGKMSTNETHWVLNLKCIDIETGGIHKTINKTYDRQVVWGRLNQNKRIIDINELADSGYMFGDISREFFPLPKAENSFEIPQLSKPVAGPFFGSFTDDRDGKTYKTVTIGDQTWMAENLNFAGVKGSLKGEGRYAPKWNGMYYNWAAAKKACPKGWHLPSSEEFQILSDHISDTYGPEDNGRRFMEPRDRGWYLMSTQDWQVYRSGWTGNMAVKGVDAFGFNAIPSGRYYWHRFVDLDETAYWWTSTPGTEGFIKGAIFWTIDDGWFSKGDSKTFEKKTKDYYIPCRCLQD